MTIYWENTSWDWHRILLFFGCRKFSIIYWKIKGGGLYISFTTISLNLQHVYLIKQFFCYLWPTFLSYLNWSIIADIFIFVLGDTVHQNHTDSVGDSSSLRISSHPLSGEIVEGICWRALLLSCTVISSNQRVQFEDNKRVWIFKMATGSVVKLQKCWIMPLKIIVYGEIKE